MKAAPLALDNDGNGTKELRHADLWSVAIWHLLYVAGIGTRMAGVIPPTALLPSQRHPPFVPPKPPLSCTNMPHGAAPERPQIGPL
jgi:hypothetical protein